VKGLKVAPHSAIFKRRLNAKALKYKSNEP